MKITSIIISLSALFVWGAASTLNADNFVQDDDVEVSIQENLKEGPMQDGVVGSSPQDYFLGTARQAFVVESVSHDNLVESSSQDYATEFGYVDSCDERPCFDVCGPISCNYSCCGWCPGFYAGLIGYGTSLKVEGEAIGLSDYFGADDCNNKITGSIWGAVLGYSCCNPCGIYFNTEFEWAIGNVSGGEHYIDEFSDRDLTNYFWTTRVGYTFNCFDCYRITPYGGVGLWYSKQDISNSGLDVSYRDWFGILGGRIDRQFCDCLWVGINGQWYVPFSSRVKLEGYCGSISLDDHYGYQVDIPFTYTTCWCGTPFTVTLSPFYRKMVNGNSDEKTFDIETIQVPMLETRVYGAKLYIGYCF